MHSIHALLMLIQEGTGDEPAPASGGGSGGFLLPMLAIFAIFWFVLIAPERKQRKLRQAMINALGKGDRVLTSGGIHGVVVQAQDDVITVQVADGVRLRFTKSAIQTVIADEPEESKGEKPAKDDKKS